MKKNRSSDSFLSYQIIRRKLLLRMKLIAILICIIGLTGSFASYSQQTKLSLNVKNTSVKDVLKMIEDQSDFSFMYNASRINIYREIDLNIEKNSMEETLKKIFENENVSYKIIGRNIIISSNSETNEFSSVEQQQKTIIGKVRDNGGVALPGVSVIIKGTSRGVITNSEGTFSISNVQDNATLVFSFVGMRPKEIPVAGKSAIEVVLEEDMIGVDEVVVVGYGTVKKVNLTGAVDHVSSKELVNRPIKDVAQGLKGIIPNLNIIESSGAPDATTKINIRGFTGMNSQASPLILVDGTPQDINQINPEDVESVSVLKDAASSAIYGSRAPYGVILITTKSGKAGKMNINFSSNVSFAEVVGLPKGVSSVEFANAWNEAFVNARQAPYYSKETLDKMQDYLDGTSNINAAIDAGNGRWGAWDKFQFGNTDWQKEGYRRWQVSQKHTASFSGGLPDGKLNYYASMGWNQTQGIMNKMLTDKYNRYNTTLKLTSKVNKWMNLSLNTKYSRQASDRPNWGTGDYSYTEQLGGRVWPTVPFYNPDGTMPYNNPILRLKLNGNTIDNNDDIWTTGAVDLTPLKGLKVTGTYTWNVHSEDYFRPNKHITAITDYTDENGKYWHYEWAYQNYPNNLTRRYNKDTYHQVELYANYDISVKNHNLSFLAGYQEELKNYSLLSGYKTALITEDVISISTAIGDSPSVDDDLSQWATRGYFGRFKYNYNEKYFIEFNGRYDASSRFPKNNRWAFFPSVSAAYNITKENFWNFDKINLFKLRGNIGELGNGTQNVGTYAYIPSMLITAKTGNVIGGTRVPSVSMPGLVSTDITWEKPRVIGFGLDLGALNNRLTVSYDWYQRTTYDQFGVAEELPEVLGTTPPVRNNAVSETRGWELSLGWQDHFKLAGKLFNWSSHFVLSDYIGYVVRYENQSGNRNDIWTRGERFGNIYGYEADQLAQSSTDFVNNGTSLHRLYNSYWFPGDLIYKDLDGNGMIDGGTSTWYNHGDQKLLGNSSPRYTYGIGLSADWNGFDLRMNFEGVGKQDLWFDGMFYQGLDRGGSMWFSTFNENSMDYWRPDNTGSFFPRPYMSGEYGSKFQVDSRYLTNGAYLRFKTLQLGYTLSKNQIMNKLSIQNLRIYSTVENVGLLINKSHVKIDPLLVRNSGGRTYPPQRTFSIGLNLTF